MKVVYLGRSTRRGSLPEPGVDGDAIELFENNWDDYGNKTTFGTACRIAGEEVELGYIKLMVEGHHYKTAAQEMQISVNTISFHLKNIYTKLRVHSKTEAVAKALRERLV